MQPQSWKKALISAVGETMRAGVGAMVQPPTSSGGKRRRRRRKEGCSPCAAMAKVDDARKRVRDGTL